MNLNEDKTQFFCHICDKWHDIHSVVTPYFESDGEVWCGICFYENNRTTIIGYNRDLIGIFWDSIED